MSYKSLVLNARPIICEDKEQRTVTASIVVEDQLYTGSSKCDDSDAEYFSSLVGASLAHMRACYTAFREKKHEARKEYITLVNAYKMVTRDTTTVDPLFEKAIAIAYNKYFKFNQWACDMACEINEYKQSREQAINFIKKAREKVK